MSSSSIIFFTRRFSVLQLDILLPSGPFTDSEKNDRNSTTPCGVMSILTRYRAADRGGMHSDFFRDFFDHHRLQKIRAVIEVFSLPLNDNLANAQNRVLSLLDTLHQLQRAAVKRSFT